MQAAAPPQLDGQDIFVRDGDPIELGAAAIRLSGLAAPEWDARGGFEATAALRELVPARW